MFSLLVTACFAPMPAVVEPKIVAASLFKNGYAVITREIDIPAGGRALVTDIPSGALGTVWLSTTDGLKLASVKNISIESKSTSPAANLLELLQLNVGREVRISVDDATTVVGKVISASTDLVMLQAGPDIVALQPSQIQRVQATGAHTDAPRSTSTRGLEIKVEGKKSGRMYLVALEKGLTWSPSYSLDISDSKKLKFVAKAILLDDVGEMKDIEARLVTGFPNVFFLGVTDPLLANATVEEYVRSLGQSDSAADAMRNQNSVAAQSQMAIGGLSGREPDFGQAMSHSQEGFGEGDLFFYRQPHVSLEKGERSYQVLADAEIPYKEIYTWDSADTVSNNRLYNYPPETPVEPDEVWHSLQFKNSIGQPLTTGPATTFKGGELLGQDLLKYTSIGSETLVKITKALDVHAESGDEELERKRGALQVPGMGEFDLVSLQTTLKATNLKTEAIHLKVTRRFTGELLTSGDAKVSKDLKGLRSINPTGKLVWERDIEPGKTVSLTFTVKVYVRSGA